MAQPSEVATIFFAVDEDDGRRFQTGEHLGPLSVQIGGELRAAVAFLKAAEVEESRYDCHTLCPIALVVHAALGCLWRPRRSGRRRICSPNFGYT